MSNPTDYATWCQHYGLDPQAKESRQEYEEAQEALAALHRAAAGEEAREAIERAREGKN